LSYKLKTKLKKKYETVEMLQTTKDLKFIFTKNNTFRY